MPAAPPGPMPPGLRPERPGPEPLPQQTQGEASVNRRKCIVFPPQPLPLLRIVPSTNPSTDQYPAPKAKLAHRDPDPASRWNGVVGRMNEPEINLEADLPKNSRIQTSARRICHAINGSEGRYASSCCIFM